MHRGGNWISCCTNSHDHRECRYSGTVAVRLGLGSDVDNVALTWSSHRKNTGNAAPCRTRSDDADGEERAPWRNEAHSTADAPRSVLNSNNAS